MTKLKNGLLALALVPAAAFAADQGLLSMVMPDAKVIAGIHVESGRNSQFGQYVLTHMQLDDENFKKFMAETGFDPRRDLTEIVMASNWAADANGRWLVLARGIFNAARIASSVKVNGGNVAEFQGVNIFSGNNTSGNTRTDNPKWRIRSSPFWISRQRRWATWNRSKPPSYAFRVNPALPRLRSAIRSTTLAPTTTFGL